MMNRREFLKSIIKTAIATGLYPVLSYAELEKHSPTGKNIERHVIGCMWCQNGCSMIAYVKNGKLVHLTGNPSDPVTKGKICIKAFGSLELLNSPYRLTYPLKRVGDRGDKAKFVRISWDEALDEIAEKLKRIKEKYGGEALGIWASGRSAHDGRYLNKAFAKLYGTPNYEKTGPFCNYSGKIAGIATVGTGHTPWIYSDDDFFSADLYILVGSNMAETRPVIFSRLMERKIKNNFTLVVIDPRKSKTAEKADLWLPIRPGTDLALALSMIYWTIQKGFVAEEFVKKYTLGFEKLKEEVLSRGYDLQWASEVTGIPKDQISYLAKTYASTKRAILVSNCGISHHTNAVQTHRAFYILAAITGHYGYKATGYCCLNNGGISIGSLPVPKHRIPKTRPELSKNPVGWLESLDNPAYPYKLRALICTGSPLTQWPDQNKVRYYISKLELSVYNGLVPNINCYYFDYILPAATWVEAGGISPVSDDSRFVWTPKLVDPPGEAKPDRWWWIELGKRMGWEDIFKDELKDPVKLQDFVGKNKGYTVRLFLSKKSNAIRAPIKFINGKVKERDTLFLDKKFLTKSGKIEIWTKSLEDKFKKYGLSAIPVYYTDPEVAKKGEETISYNKLVSSPFQKNKCLTFSVKLIKTEKERGRLSAYLITGRPSVAIMGHTSHWIRKLNQVCAEQFCLIHPELAGKLNLKDGDYIKLVSDRGEVEAIAKVSPRIRKDTVFVPYSFGKKSPFSQWSTVNFLTNLGDRCPVSGQIAFKGVKVFILKRNSNP